MLGGGGGGDPLSAGRIALEAINRHGPVSLLGIDDLQREGVIVPVAAVGSPTVIAEKLTTGEEGARLATEAAALLGRPAVALAAAEMAGANALLPVSWAAAANLPLVDASVLDRAFPSILQAKPNIVGTPPGPCLLTDEHGNVIVVRSPSNAWAAELIRTITDGLGGMAATATYITPVDAAEDVLIPGTVTKALRIGELASESRTDPLTALAAELDLEVLFRGRVTEIHRDAAGYVRGHAVIRSDSRSEERLLRVEMQNEYILAIEDGRVLASTPDVIVLFDVVTAKPIAADRLRYGHRVTVAAFPVDPVWRSEAGLALGGPSWFGLDVDYVPLGGVD